MTHVPSDLPLGQDDARLIFVAANSRYAYDPEFHAMVTLAVRVAMAAELVEADQKRAIRLGAAVALHLATPAATDGQVTS